MPLLDSETRQLVTKARVLGSGALSVFLADDELLKLCAVVATDLDETLHIQEVVNVEELNAGYYGIPLEWFSEPLPVKVSFEQKFLALRQDIPDFATYFKNLCALHKRRIKFKHILEYQPLPKMEQIVPRCLLEYGMKPSEALASWLVWRKWLYDVDNRSAQETGYLFEPILASAIGG